MWKSSDKMIRRRELWSHHHNRSWCKFTDLRMKHATATSAQRHIDSRWWMTFPFITRSQEHCGRATKVVGVCGIGWRVVGYNRQQHFWVGDKSSGFQIPHAEDTPADVQLAFSWPHITHQSLVIRTTTLILMIGVFAVENLAYLIQRTTNTSLSI